MVVMVVRVVELLMVFVLEVRVALAHPDKDLMVVEWLHRLQISQVLVAAVQVVLDLMVPALQVVTAALEYSRQSLVLI
jgi:hypothetical protein